MRIIWLLHASLITHVVFHVRATCDVQSYPTCDPPMEYHCQYEDSNDFQVEFCAATIGCEAGNHAVLDNVTKSVTCKECAEGMFQSEGKNSSIFIQPNCDERVTLCNEKEYVCENATTRQNTKCACNETAGYKQNCNQVCFSKDSVCGCELQDLSPPSTPVLTKNVNLETGSKTAGGAVGFAILAGVFIVGCLVMYVCKSRKSCCKKKEDAVAVPVIRITDIEKVDLQTRGPVEHTEYYD